MKHAKVLLVLSVCLVGAVAAQGANVTWQTTDGDPTTIDGNWEDTANWLSNEDPAQVRLPLAGDNVQITNGATVLVSDTTTIPDGAASADWIRSWNIQGGSTLLQTGGTVPKTTNNIWLGNNTAGGTYRLEGGTLLSKLDICGKNAGLQVGNFIQTGGTADLQSLRMCYKNSKGKAYIDIEGGLFKAPTMLMASGTLSNYSTAIVTQTGGTIEVSNQIKLGEDVGDGTVWPGEASIHLDGGEMTISGAAPFVFSQPGEPVYVDFDGGLLNLKGTWDFDALTGITDSDFRVAGEAATADDLVFTPITIDTVDYTQIAMVSGPTADFNGDGVVDLVDVNLLTAEADLPTGLMVPLADAKFDLSGDGVVGSADLDQWLVDAATINGLASPYLKGDTNVDGDVDVWAFDGTGDAQVLSENLGTMTGMVWGDGDFNGDGDVDVWAFDGSGDAQQLSSNLGATSDATAGTAEAIYNALTGELSFDVGEGVGVIGVMAVGLDHEAVDGGSPLGAPGQNDGSVLAYFSASGLTTGMSSVGVVLPTGLTADDINFAYTPLGGKTTAAAVTVIVPEPSTIAMLLLVGAMAFFRRRRRA